MFVEDSNLTRYNGYNPEFVRKVWAKRQARERANHVLRRREQIARLYEEGLTTGQIAQKMGMTKNAVSGAMAHFRRQCIDIPAPEWVKLIVAQTCRKHGLDPVTALTRFSRNAAPCRYEIFWRVYKHPNEPSYPQIGRWFGLDHSAVYHAVRKHAASLDQHNQ